MTDAEVAPYSELFAAHPAEPAAVAIDPPVLKALASDTRRDMMRALTRRRMTLSELARAMDLKKATVLEHLERLTDAGLVRRCESDERVWVYYELTRKGGQIVNPGATRFRLLVGLSTVAICAGIAMLAVAQVSFAPVVPGALGVTVSDAHVAPGAQFQALVVAPESVDSLEAYLLPAGSLKALGTGEGSVDAVPLHLFDESVETLPGSTARMRSVSVRVPSHGVEAGAYAFYVRDADLKSDNRDNLPLVQVSRTDDGNGVPPQGSAPRERVSLGASAASSAGSALAYIPAQEMVLAAATLALLWRRAYVPPKP
ncbi:MAG TPA: winged helix-turn-helix domain-containing protein [Candidatus Thermoplasmatota archaeon]|nr:winged helix-turn-helix domain-containing protein [Candidatus Thermoplasmatota archaeon]